MYFMVTVCLTSLSFSLPFCPSSYTRTEMVKQDRTSALIEVAGGHFQERN